MYVFRRKKCYLARYYLFSTIVSTNAEPPGTGWLACPTSINIIICLKLSYKCSTETVCFRRAVRQLLLM